MLKLWKKSALFTGKEMRVVSDKIKWTPQQEEAIKASADKLLVSASAGTGKTMVLVERVLDALTRKEKPLDISQLLVVTFTEAAAAEMRDRIGSSLLSRIKQNPSSPLKEQLLLLPKASISTLHSFCLEIIRRYFYLLDLDPAFSVAGEMEALLMQLEAWEALLQSYYDRENNQHFLNLLDSYGATVGDEKLGELVRKLYNFSRSQPFPEKWLAEVGSFYKGSSGKVKLRYWLDQLLLYLQEELAYMENLLSRGITLASSPNGPARYLDNLQQELEGIQALASSCRNKKWQQLRENWLAFSFAPLPPVRRDQADEFLKEQVKALRDEVKTIFKKHAESFFLRSLEDYSREVELVTPYIDTLLELTKAFHESYSQAKKEKRLLDFSDLEHYCLALLAEEKNGSLQPSPVARELQRQYRQVLVDEYQDINSVQETILQLLTSGTEHSPSLFMVGDVKQSIYRFRLAEPSLFLKKFHSFSTRVGSPCRRLHLTENFRCREEIVKAVNFLFAQLFSP
ncbi:MAG: UvrD-helicase domain-containing protein, partial [Firmicutes bacterium]|nr:UvrD-helicase domain-containing protein [Bacillota bacterium]